MKRLALLMLLTGCAAGTTTGEPQAPEPPDFSVVDATSDTVTIRSDAEPDDPFIVAEAQRLCAAFGKSATYFSSHDSDEVNETATALIGLTGSRHISYVTEHLFLCR